MNIRQVIKDNFDWSDSVISFADNHIGMLELRENYEFSEQEIIEFCTVFSKELKRGYF